MRGSLFRAAVGLSVLTCISGAGQAAQAPSAGKPVDDQDSYAIYAAILPDEWPMRVAKAKTLVIREETSTFSACVPSGRPMEEEWREVLDAYRHENAEPRRIVAGRELGIPYVVLPYRQFQSVMTWNPAEPAVVGWDLFYRRYPDSGGYVSVSAVGFDQTRRRALVYMGHSCNNLCGGGTYHLLEKVGGSWREIRPDGLKSCAWAS